MGPRRTSVKDAGFQESDPGVGSVRTLPWRNPEAPTTPLEEKQRKPITVMLVLTTSYGNRIHHRTWNERSRKPAPAAADVIKIVGEQVQRYSGRVRRHPAFEPCRSDMFHVLRHTYASVQLEAGESVVSLSRWLGVAAAARRGVRITWWWRRIRTTTT
ncbi:hypothetical protein GA0115254_11513 [Streptomyces sp. Ncost-T10-10d]|nr:hypothetical protein GA0115254_11513 [Streptomyces sp. Ncost-T10-10d]